MTVNPSRDEVDVDRPYDPFGPNRAHQHREDINVWHRDLTKGFEWEPECGCREDRLCFKHKLRTIQFGGRGKSPQTLMERQWEKDRPAYQALRRQGLQPKSIKGSHDLAQRANSQTEIEMGHIFPKDILPRVEEGMAISRDLEWTPKENPDAVSGALARRKEGKRMTPEQKKTVEKDRVR